MFVVPQFHSYALGKVSLKAKFFSFILPPVQNKREVYKLLEQFSYSAQIPENME